MRIFSLIFFFTLVQLSSAQLYHGRIIDAGTRKPVPEAQIILKHAKYKTFSDAKGFFYIPRDFCFNGDKDTLKFSASRKDTIVISSSSFEQAQYAVHQGKDYELLPVKASSKQVDYFNNMPNKAVFDYLDGNPLTQPFGEVRSVKFIYDFKKDQIYFFNFNKYSYHAHFAVNVLKFNSQQRFNAQYYNSPERKYFIGEVCHYTASNTYTCELFAGSEMTCDQLKLLYNKIADNSFIGSNLHYLSYNREDRNCEGIKGITHNYVYRNQKYQALNYGVGYGYLRFVDVNTSALSTINKHDIVVMNDLPLDISVTAGMISNKFQMPLGHLNVLSHNRGTPNMALRSVWSNEKMRALNGKLVCLKVSGDTFSIREVQLPEAEKFWKVKEQKIPQKLERDDKDSGLVDLSKKGIFDISLIGGKAANFSELLKVKNIYTPEAAFAIPFYYYAQHLKKYGLDIYIDKMLADTLFSSDRKVKQDYLQRLQDSILRSPLDTVLVKQVIALFQSKSTSNSIRFRSSTNAEDVIGFNGAGLYDSYTGKIGSAKKPVDLAIKKVWASLWNLEAVEERDYFKIDQHSVAMAVLVHRNFPNEDANGVVITENQYNATLPAYVINVQAGELPVVGNFKDTVADQIILYLFNTTPDKDYSVQYVTHSNLAGMEDSTVLSEAELVELRKAVDKIYDHYCTIYRGCKHLDIEFKLESTEEYKRRLYIKQVRVY
ncbi:MAG: PEP/pyruvate-binding domain-containing protein [Flavobacteriales bacterium]